VPVPILLGIKLLRANIHGHTQLLITHCIEFSSLSHHVHCIVIYSSFTFHCALSYHRYEQWVFFPLFFRFMTSGPSSMSCGRTPTHVLAHVVRETTTRLVACPMSLLSSFVCPSLVATCIYTCFSPKARYLSFPLTATTYPTYSRSSRTLSSARFVLLAFVHHINHTPHPTHYPIRS